MLYMINLLEPQFGQTRDGYMPDPSEIAVRCAELQSRWSDDEERKRRQWSVVTGKR